MSRVRKRPVLSGGRPGRTGPDQWQDTMREYESRVLENGIKFKTAVLSAGDIVGSESGKLGASDLLGFELIQGIPDGAILVLGAYCRYYFQGVAYTGGAASGLIYRGTSAIGISNTVNLVNAASVGREATLIPVSLINTSTATNLISGASVALRSTTPFTQPGGANGTVRVDLAYVVVPALA